MSEASGLLFGLALPCFACKIVQTYVVPVGFLVVIVVLGVWCVLAIGGAVGGIALEQKGVAADPSGIRYRLQSGPTEIPWITAFNLEAGWITLPVHWARYWCRRSHTWSVTVRQAESWWQQPNLIDEAHATRQEAEQRHAEIHILITKGLLMPGTPSR
jgi:hypothetical protein